MAFQYKEILINLATARGGTEGNRFDVGEAHTLYIYSNPDEGADLTVRFDSSSALPIKAQAGLAVNFDPGSPYHSLYFENSAGAGTARLYIGYNMNFHARQRVTANEIADSILQQSVTVGTSAVALPTAAIADRSNVVLQNLGSSHVYIGNSSVVTSTGLRVDANGGSVALTVGQGVTLYGISGSTGQDVRVLEGA